MGNAMAILIGVICVFLGAVSLYAWWPQFVAVLMGCIGVTLLCGGLLALAIGISEMRAAKEFESAVPPAPPVEDKVDQSNQEAPAAEASAEETDSSGQASQSEDNSES